MILAVFPSGNSTSQGSHWNREDHKSESMIASSLSSSRTPQSVGIGMISPPPQVSNVCVRLIVPCGNVRDDPYTRGKSEGCTRSRTLPSLPGCQSFSSLGTFSSGSTAFLIAFLRVEGTDTSDLTTQASLSKTMVIPVLS